MNFVLMVAVAVILVVVVVVLARRRTDGVDSFRRQIDALSAESRRSTVDQVREAERRRERADRRGRADGSSPTDDPSSSSGDGTRGS